MAEDMMEDGAGDFSGSRPRNTRRLLIFIAAPLLLLIAAAAGLYFSGIAEVLLGKHEEVAKADAPPPPPKEAQFCNEIPDLLVNLNTGGRKSNFLKIKIVLQVDSKDDCPKIKNIEPRVIDTFQTYLRELRLEDLKGSAGLYRLREELLLRINAAASPTKVDDVLFEEMLVQ